MLHRTKQPKKRQSGAQQLITVLDSSVLLQSVQCSTVLYCAVLYYCVIVLYGIDSRLGVSGESRVPVRGGNDAQPKPWPWL